MWTVKSERNHSADATRTATSSLQSSNSQLALARNKPLSTHTKASWSSLPSSRARLTSLARQRMYVDHNSIITTFPNLRFSLVASYSNRKTLLQPLLSSNTSTRKTISPPFAATSWKKTPRYPHQTNPVSLSSVTPAYTPSPNGSKYPRWPPLPTRRSTLPRRPRAVK